MRASSFYPPQLIWQTESICIIYHLCVCAASVLFSPPFQLETMRGTCMFIWINRDEEMCALPRTRTCTWAQCMYLWIIIYFFFFYLSSWCPLRSVSLSHQGGKKWCKKTWQPFQTQQRRRWCWRRRHYQQQQEQQQHACEFEKERLN